MVQQSPVASAPPWLDLKRLIAFIDELREADFNIGVLQYIAVQDLLLALQAKGQNLQKPEQLRNFLGPLLCSSPQEQEDFQHRFNQWIQRMGMAVDEPVATTEEEARAQQFERELKKIERKSRWVKWGLLALSAFIAAILIHFLIQQWPVWFFRASQLDVPQPIEPSPSQSNIPRRWLALLGGLALLPFATSTVWRIWQFWIARQYLSRRTTTQRPELQQVTISGIEEDLFPTVLFLRISQGFRRRIRVPSRELNVQGTVTKTVRNGGQFSPVYGYRQVFPEYLFLIDRSTYNDQQARFMTEMMHRLINNGVFITGYYFDADPRICFPLTGKGAPRKLGEIAAKYGEHRLLVFSDAEVFFGSLTGEPEPWMEVFSAWSDRAVLTPKPAEHWGYQELELSREFMVLPATVNGLADLVQCMQSGESSFEPLDKEKALYPEDLRVRSQRWIEREPPEGWLIVDVLAGLRDYLGEAGYYWLGACAIFPELHWNLTVYLGTVLKTTEGKSLLQACRMTDLARLPWFRCGSIPDWLRLCLIYEMPRQQEVEVRQHLEIFLALDPNELNLVGKLQLEIARQQPHVTSLLAQLRLRAFPQQASGGNPLHDHIFQGFMAGRKPLAVRIPKELRQALLTSSKPFSIQILKKLRQLLLRRPSRNIKWGLGFRYGSFIKIFLMGKK